MNKKILIIGIISLIIIGLLLGFVYLSRTGRINNDYRIGDLFPFGSEIENDNREVDPVTGLPINDSSSLSPTTNDNNYETLLYTINEPVLNYQILTFDNKELLLYTNNSGNIFYIDLYEADKKPIRLTNKTITGIEKISFGYNQNNITAIGHIPDKNQFFWLSTPLQEVGEEEADFDFKILNEPILDFTLSPDNKRIFILEKLNDKNVGFITDLNLNNKIKILELDFEQLLISWPEVNNILVQTKPSYYLDGFLFSVNPNTGNLDRILSNKKGLTSTMSPDGEKVIFTSNVSTITRTSVYSIEGKEIVNLGSDNILIDKCSWTEDNYLVCLSPNLSNWGIYPDDWYKGKTIFSNYRVVFYDFRDLKNIKSLPIFNYSLDNQIKNIKINNNGSLIILNFQNKLEIHQLRA